MACEMCGHLEISVTDKPCAFEYRPMHGGGIVILCCWHKVYECTHCHLSYTMADAEEAKEKAVNEFENRGDYEIH